MLTDWFECLLMMALTALSVMAVVLLARLVLRRAPKKYTYLLWLVVAFRLVCPVALESPVGLVPAEEISEQIAGAADTYIEPTLTYVDNGGFTPDYGVLLDRGYTPNERGEIITNAAGTREAWQVEDLLRAGSALWLLGMTAMAGYLVWTTLRLRHQVATAVRWEGNVWECDGIPTPFVLGLLWPRIYIPFRMSEGERAYILAHERYHIRHGDPWAKLLGLLLLTVYWWNPAVWLCWVLFCRDMEMRCDEAVLEQLGDDVKREYSLSLVSFALDRRAPMALAFGEHDAAKRVKHVLHWKKAAPAAAFLAVCAVLLVVMVCGTNTELPKSRVSMDMGENGLLEFEAEVTEDLHSWALYLDVYDGGHLIRSAPCVMDGFADEGAGVSTRTFTGTLWEEVEYALGGGFTDTMHWRFDCFGLAEFQETLPRTHYTGKAAVFGDGSDLPQEYEFGPEGGEVLLCSILLSQKENGATTVYTADTSMIQRNDTVLQFRLVLSDGTMEELPETQLDLAQRLYELRMGGAESEEEQANIRTVVNMVSGYNLPSFELTTARQAQYGGLVVELAFDQALDEEQQRRIWNAGCLLLALVEDVEQVTYAFPEENGGAKRFTYYVDRPQPDAWAEKLGYEDIKSLGSSAAGIRMLLDYLDFGGGEEEVNLFVRSRQMEPPAFLELLMATPLWQDRVEPCTLSVPGNFGLYADFEKRPEDPDALDTAMARRAILMMRLYPELVGYVTWTYPGEDGERERRMFHSDEMIGILSLSSALQTYELPKNQPELDGLIRFLNLDQKLFVHYAADGNAFSPERVAEAGAVWFTPEDVYDLELAVLEWWDGQRFTPPTGEQYDYLTERLSEAKEIMPTGCPFGEGVLYFHRADGVVGKVHPATDGCQVFFSNGRYYEYNDRNAPGEMPDGGGIFAPFDLQGSELPLP